MSIVDVRDCIHLKESKVKYFALLFPASGLSQRPATGNFKQKQMSVRLIRGYENQENQLISSCETVRPGLRALCHDVVPVGGGRRFELIHRPQIRASFYLGFADP
jgi:hypothetical protein